MASILMLALFLTLFLGALALLGAAALASAVTPCLRRPAAYALGAALFGGSVLALGFAPAVSRLWRRLDWGEQGGVPLLGVNGVCIIAHGRSHARAIKNAIRVASEAAAGGLVEHITEGMRTWRATLAPLDEVGA